jgi:thiamine-monophosphate kinase
MSVQNKRTDVNEYGEFGLIQHLTKNFRLQQNSSIKGIGDDAAVISASPDRKILISTDMLVEGVHFDLTYTPLKHLGYKAVVVNLSDIYAMNGHPEQITVSIALSNRFSVEALEEIYAGIKAACDFYKVDLVGGDTTSSLKGLILSITALGSVKEDEVVYRNGAMPGDLICVSGDLGAAYLGLQILEREKQVFLADPNAEPDLENQDYLISKILKPEARFDTIQTLRKAGIKPSAMIDISDGLASEIHHICAQSKTGALIEEKLVPIHQEAELMAFKFKLDPIVCALNGGEDYELLFTIAPEYLEQIKVLPGIYIIGEVRTEEEGIRLETSGGNLYPISAQGWNHFRD